MIAAPPEMRFAETPFGRTAFQSKGAGPPAIFLHGLGLNSHFWRFQLEALGDLRRCLAPDLLAHGFTDAAPTGDYSFRAQANMVLAFADALDLDRFDLVGNDSGGAISQMVAAIAPHRVRSIMLTNCDVHDNWPPPGMGSLLWAARANMLGETFKAIYRFPVLFRSELGYASKVYSRSAFADDALVRRYVGPLIRSQAQIRAITRYTRLEFENQLVEIESPLRKVAAPVRIVWGKADTFFPQQWAHWLHSIFPNVEAPILVDGARLYFPEETPAAFNPHIQSFWLSS